jgi:ATP-dependent RNA helicase DDX46/PRP5
MAYSPSRRSEDRHVRDRRDDRGTRRRSRSREVRGHRRPSPRHPSSRNPSDLTYIQRNRDSYRRRDHSHDRYDDRRDDRRSGRRDRSRDRKRSRDRSPVRDRRDDRERYRDSRDSYDNRDRKRPRRSPSPRRDDRPRDGGGRDRRTPARTSERGSEVRVDANPQSRTKALTEQTPRPSTANADPAVTEKQAEEKRKQEERRAKMEAWKAKLLAEKAQGSGSAATPPAATPDNVPSKESTPVGKPDPKEIQRRVRAAKAKQEDAKSKPLGGDVAIPTPLPEQVASAPGRGSSNATPEPAKLPTKVAGFGLNKVAEKSEQQAPKAVSQLDEEETSVRKLGKLPHLTDTSMDAIPEHADDDEDDENNDLRSDDEADEADRQAAQKRAQQVEQSAAQNASSANGTSTANEISGAMDVDEDDDVDPLDAYMNSLEAPVESDPLDRIGSSRQEAVVFNSDDEPELDAMGDASDDIAAMIKKSKKKEIGQVVHSKMNYQPFRKNFYSESLEIAEMTEEEVDELRADLENITVKGKSPPRPIQKFAQGGFGAQIMQIINELQFSTPSSIQSQALPAIMSGRDTIGVAKTGSGKTMAFVLPMFRHIKDQPPLETMDGPIGMIMAPTRELAVQIHRDCKPFLKALNLRAVCAYGGAPIKDQIAELKRGAEIVVCTPGRMIDLLAANNGRVTNLRRVTYVVMDEADRMFDMGFEPQITKILMNVRPDRQTILFSATFPPKMEVMARKALKNPVEILVGGKSVVAAEITQVVEVREANTRFTRLLQLLGELFYEDDDIRCLVFVERQETADELFKELSKKNYASVSIHGGREQIDRDEAIQNFKQGVFPIMIATSVAARGLDVKQLKMVVNFDCPNHNEDYVHRCGRTGRAGNTGTAVTFVMPDQDRFAAFLVKSLTESKQEIPEDLKALADKFNKKVEAGETKKYGGGFGGKGIERLDAARQAEEGRMRKQYRTEDQPEEEETTEPKKEGGKEETTSKAVEAAESMVPAHLASILRNAMNVQKAEPPPPSANDGPGKSGGRPKGLDPMEAARQAAMNITNRVGGNKGSSRRSLPFIHAPRTNITLTGAARAGQHVDNHGPDAGAFHATLEINDFPQRARWAVTNRTNTSKILDTAQVSITTKGNYYPPPKGPEEGELPKLYILVEGPTKIIVEDSMAELVRLLKEGTIAALEGEASKPQAAGRYSVV